MKAGFSAAALAVALILAGCGDDAGNLGAAAANSNAPLPQIPAPNNGDWTQVVSRTATGATVMGNPQAPVKLVEYGSLTCPACRAFSQQGTERLRDTYVRSGQVSWEFRHLVIHGAPDVALAMLTDCQPPAAFFRTIEQIYTQQSEIVDRLDQNEQQQIQALPPEQQLAPLARAMELDSFFARRGMPESRQTQCLGNIQAAQRLADNANRAANEEGVQGTPTFFINGEKLDVSDWAGVEGRLRAAIAG
ncbi:MAG TPA: thioredoxin domain-containing protein [Allosphingosinicella sp.]|nr:thioredoxin domain-containing protein [Allosphingosinicella sp.]